MTKAADAKSRKLGRKAHQEKPAEFAKRIFPRIEELQKQELSLRGIAKNLNEESVLTTCVADGTWSHQSVSAVFERIKA